MTTYDLVYQDINGNRIAESGDGSPFPKPGTLVAIDGFTWIVVSHQWYVNTYSNRTVTTVVITVRKP